MARVPAVNQVDPLTSVTLGPYAYVHDGVSYDPAVLVRYVLHTGARGLPLAHDTAINLAQLADALSLQAADGHSGANITSDRRVTGPAARMVAGLPDETISCGPLVLQQLANAQRADHRSVTTEACLPATFFADEVRIQLELALQLCELDAVDSPMLAFHAFVASPWLVLRLVYAGFLMHAPLHAAKAAVEAKARVRACLQAAVRMANGDELEEHETWILYNHLVLTSVAHAVFRLCDAVLAVVRQPANTLLLSAVFDPGPLEPPIGGGGSSRPHSGTGGTGEDDDDNEDSEGSEEEEDRREVPWDPLTPTRPVTLQDLVGQEWGGTGQEPGWGLPSLLPQPQSPIVLSYNTSQLQRLQVPSSPELQSPPRLRAESPLLSSSPPQLALRLQAPRFVLPPRLQEGSSRWLSPSPPRAPSPGA